MLTVACFLWRDAARKRSYSYGPRHVLTLKRMVARHLLAPHRFVCIADRPIDGVETVPLDRTTHVPGTCFVKLMLWRPDIECLLGERILALDLDCVVTGSLDAIAARSEDVVLWRNPNFGAPRRAFYQGSIALLHAGARPELFEDFDPRTTPAWVNRRFGGAEQAWLSERLRWDEAFFDARDGVHGAGRLGDRAEGVGTSLPENARVVFFPGDREPSQPAMQERHGWIRDHYY